MNEIYAGRESQPGFHLENRIMATKAREGAAMVRHKSRASLRRKLEGSIVRKPVRLVGIYKASGLGVVMHRDLQRTHENLEIGDSRDLS